MRIVDVCAFYAPQGGGVKTYVERKLTAGAALGHEIVILAPGPSRQTILHGPGARIEIVPGGRLPVDGRYHYFNDEAGLHAALDALRPDFVEASSPWGSAAMVGRWRGSAGRALVMHADPLATYAYRWFGAIASRRTIDRGFDWFWRHLRALDRRFDRVVSASISLSDRLVEGGLKGVVTHPMGVEPGIFSPARRDPELRAILLRRCGLGPDATLLLGVGRFAAEKRWPMVIEAVTAAGYGRSVGLMLVGGGRASASVVRAAGHNPHITLAAPITDRNRLATVMASADALVHGCEAETFCMIAAEAKASGLPLIVPDRGGASDQWRTGCGGRYRAGDGKALAQAIGNLVDDRLVAHSRRATEEAAATRTMDAHFAELFGDYRRIAEGTRRAA